MKKLLKILGLLPIIKQISSFKILAFDYGHYKSIKDWDCVDGKGNKIPWYSYAVIEYLNNLDFSDKLIFEYGCGNSSIYWSDRAKEVISVEDDVEWYNKIKRNLKSNQQLFLVKADSEYENSISSHNKLFDVIIIDGDRRDKCARVVKDFLNTKSKDGYMVILDNSSWFLETSRYLRNELNLIEIDFHGFAPILRTTTTTSIFISRNFNFQPLDNKQPNLSVGEPYTYHPNHD